MSEFALAKDSGPNVIAAGPDGALWCTTGKANCVGRITVEGRIDTVPVPGGGELMFIAAGPDRNMWFTATEPARIGRVNLDLDPSGPASER